MIKKAIIPLMMILASAAIIPGASVKEATKVNAEETTTNEVTNKTKIVEKGYIANNLVNSNGIIDLTNSDTLTKMSNSNALSGVYLKPTSYDDSFFKDTFLKYTKADKLLTGPTINNTTVKFSYKSSSDDYDRTQWGLTSYVQSGTTDNYDSTKERFFTINYGLDYIFPDWDESKEQPLELVIPISLSDIETGLIKCFPFIMSPELTPKKGTVIEKTFPIISINGYDYFTATLKYGVPVSGSPKTTITYNSNNARAYIAYGQNSAYAGYVCMEIPFTSYLQNISIANYVKTTGNVHTSQPVRQKMIQISAGAVNKKIKAPIVITDLDFKEGIVSTLTSNSFYVDSNNNEYINAVDQDYIRLDSLVIDSKYTLYTKRTGEHPTPREDVYELYVDSDYKNRFTYDSDNELANKLRDAKDSVKVTISKYNYSILKKENLSSTEYATTSDFVDCGNFYAFKKINKDQIHTVTFNAIKDTGRGSMLDRLAFSAYDNTTSFNITKISAIMFYYSFYYNYHPNYDNGKIYSLSISAQDLINGGVESGNKEVFKHWFQESTGNIIHKKDKFGTQFCLTGLKKNDYKYFNWDDASEEIQKTDKSEMFLICNEGVNSVRVTFESVVSCVYIDKNGDLINCSSIFPDGIIAPTAIIDDDGKVTLIDFNGNVIPGSVDPKTGVFVDESGKPYDPPDNVENPTPTNPIDKLLKQLKQIASVVCTVAIVAGVIWCISKLGPTIVAIVKKKE